VISLKRQLVLWLIGLLAAVGLLAGGISYFIARDAANEFLDHQLVMIAESVHTGSQLRSMQAKFLTDSKEDQENGFVIQVWNDEEPIRSKEPIRSSRPNFNLPRSNAIGYSDALLADEKWRVYTLIYPDRTVQVSQSYVVRQEIAANAALCALLPILGLLPLSWVLVVIGVSRILKPLSDVTNAVTKRDATSLTPLPSENVPIEVAPLITELNGLLLRIRETIESQRHFVMDAAHELRTPLTALQLQIENLSQSRSQDDLDARITYLRSGMNRATHLVEQLLKMAHYGAEQQSIRVKVDLGDVVKTCIGDFIPIAEKRQIDLGMTHDETSIISANADDLRVLFDNLLDNAIRYTPEGGQVDVSIAVSGQQVIVTIVDTGPGIPESLLQRVFDRFFRAGSNETDGSGIGLAIVNAIAIRETAEVVLSNRQDRSGLIAAISFNRSDSGKHADLISG
jgi:two-component system OmpR family sensor kinase/two-component system sensor histidine kinase QseC